MKEPSPVEQLVEAKEVYFRLSKRLTPGSVWLYNPQTGMIEPAYYVDNETGKSYENPAFIGFNKKVLEDAKDGPR